jgi:hypothetical protein
MNRLPYLRTNGINVTALLKGPEKYILLFDDAHRSEGLRQLGRWATDRGLSFTWADAARMSQQVREGMRKP